MIYTSYNSLNDFSHPQNTTKHVSRLQSEILIWIVFTIFWIKILLTQLNYTVSINPKQRVQKALKHKFLFLLLYA